MCIEVPVRMGTSSVCIGRTRRAYVGIGHAKKFILIYIMHAVPM